MSPRTNPSPLEGRLAEAAAALMRSQPGLRVIAARAFRLPFAKLSARVALQSPRRFNILEEFVLRAAAELEPPPAPPELAAMLGLDQLFVDTTLQHLDALKSVCYGQRSVVRLTASGRKYFEHGQVLQAPTHKTISLLYRGAFDALEPWVETTPAAGDLPVWPGLSSEEREDLTARALAAATPAALKALALDGPWPPPAGTGPSPSVTSVDQLAVENIGFYPIAVLCVQDLLAAEDEDNLSLRAWDLASGASDPVMQRRLEDWLEAGRATMEDFLPSFAGRVDTNVAAGSGPDYAALYRQQVRAKAKNGRAGLRLLPAGDFGLATKLLAAAKQRVLVLLPQLSGQTLDDGLHEELAALSHCGVVSLVGWGAAGERGQEPDAPDEATVDALAALHTPDGIPAAAIWWLGQLRGQDVLIDRQTLLARVPTELKYAGRRLQAEAALFAVTTPELVAAAVDELEPPFARAARAAWSAASRTPRSNGGTLERCCVTWVAVGRPGEALSHIVKLAAADQANLRLAWDLLTVTCLALGHVPEADLDASDASDALQRALPAFLDWADTVEAEALPAFVAAFHDLLSQLRHTSDDLPVVLKEASRLWAERGQSEEGQRVADVFAPPVIEAKNGKVKKRRY